MNTSDTLKKVVGRKTKKKNTCFRIDPELIKELDEIGEVTHRNRSNLLTICVMNMISYYRKYGTLDGFIPEDIESI
jgi:hypothetical protein